MKQFFRLLLSFAPWLAFLFLSGHTLASLRISIVVAAAITILMAMTGLHRGAVLYAGYLFFSFALVFVVWNQNMWVIQRLGILANGTLYATTLLTMILGKPFTADYAKVEVSPDIWDSGGFIRSCYMTTSVWSLVFLLNLLAAIISYYDKGIERTHVEIFNYSVLLSGVIYTCAYTRIRRRHAVTPAATQQDCTYHQCQ